MGETQLDKRQQLQKIKCREIVGEIIRFGVSQQQLVYLIKLLALELEDMELARDLATITSGYASVSDEADMPAVKHKIYT